MGLGLHTSAARQLHVQHVFDQRMQYYQCYQWPLAGAQTVS